MCWIPVIQLYFPREVWKPVLSHLGYPPPVSLLMCSSACDCVLGSLSPSLDCVTSLSGPMSLFSHPPPHVRKSAFQHVSVFLLQSLVSWTIVLTDISLVTSVSLRLYMSLCVLSPLLLFLNNYAYLSLSLYVVMSQCLHSSHCVLVSG